MFLCRKHKLTRNLQLMSQTKMNNLFILALCVLAMHHECLPVNALTSDGLALLEFKKGLNNETGQVLLQTWNESDASPCHWEGIQCTTLGFVGTIALSNVRAGGTISGALGKLQHLTVLDLESNQLQGNIPWELENCTRLVTLNLMDNQLSGQIPAGLGNLSSLAEVKLAKNALRGKISSAVAACANLSVFNVSANYLSGTVPAALSKNPKLRELFIGENNLTGDVTTVLEELSKISDIIHIQMDDNTFTGTLPPSLGNCSKLQYLDLGGNNLQGTIPSSLGQCQSLQTLILDTNARLTGILPPELGQLQMLTTVVIYGTMIYGAIPASLGNCSSLEYLVLTTNHLNGTIPGALGRLSKLLFLNLANNKLSGTVPLELGNCTSLRVLQLGSNQLEGEFRVDFSKVSTPELVVSVYNNFISGNIFESLATHKNFTIVDVCKNSLTGEIPAYVDVKSLSKLQVLMLGYNNLVGPIPTWMFDLPKMQVLDISHNNLTGELSGNFSNFQGFINKNVTQVPHNCHDLANYYTQDFGFNLKLRNYSVSMTYLSYLTFLDLAVNRLSGNIPSNIGELSNLFYLNLSTNALTGQIPVALGAITPLQSVDLSSNLLDGPIPQDFGSLKRLDIFMVGNNNLSGPIPTGPQMQTFTSDSYLPGNDNLCGNPLTRICPSNSSNSESGFKTVPQTLLEKINDWLSVPGFCVGFAIGFISFAVFTVHYYLSIQRREGNRIAPASGRQESTPSQEYLYGAWKSRK